MRKMKVISRWQSSPMIMVIMAVKMGLPHHWCPSSWEFKKLWEVENPDTVKLDWIGPPQFWRKFVGLVSIWSPLSGHHLITTENIWKIDGNLLMFPEVWRYSTYNHCLASKKTQLPNTGGQLDRIPLERLGGQLALVGELGIAIQMCIEYTYDYIIIYQMIYIYIYNFALIMSWYTKAEKVGIPLFDQSK